MPFIANVYFPCWFHVKINHSWVDGPRNVLFELSSLRIQPKEVQSTLMPTVRPSAWFAHSEAILMTMLCEEEEEERRFAVLQITSFRGEQEMSDSSLRLRTLPYLNVQGTNLQNLIDWEGDTELIVTCNLTKSDLLKYMAKPMVVKYYLCHTQAIERAVKEVTVAASAVCGTERRDGFIRWRAQHIELVPRINSKQDLIGITKIITK